MAVSGSKDFSITRGQIIASAYRKIGIFDIGEGVSGDETSAADFALNLMIKEWLARGADIHLRQNLTVFLQPNQTSYTFSSSSSDDYTNDTVVETTLSADEASGQTVISVTSSSGMTASDRVGIKLDDHTIHWTTISSVDTSTQITIASATTGAASSGNKVYAYTNKGDVPRKLVYQFRRDKHGLDTEIDRIGESEYHRLTDKDASGPPTQVYYRPGVGMGELFVWPTDWGANGDRLELVTRVMPDDFDAAANSPDFPIEWGNTIVWGLAAELAAENGIPRLEQQNLWTISQMKFNEMLDYDVENASVVFSMDYDA